jgi:DNA topoisomerase II
MDTVNIDINKDTKQDSKQKIKMIKKIIVNKTNQVKSSKSSKSISADKKDLNKDNLGTIYQKKTDIEHILDAPDTYIGSIEEDEVKNWIYDDKTHKMIYKSYRWIPGLYKCFDEGIVNARDHYVRMSQKIEKSKNTNKSETKTNTNYPVKTIDVGIDKETGVITMINDGNGIDIAKHPEYNIWIPELIFGHLRTSTNYNKNEKKITGGKNGFGFKLVLIYSKWGTIETVDHVRHLKYVQEFKNNLEELCPPKITSYKGKPYTKVSWLPDYKRFGLKDGNLTKDMYDLFLKRTYDIAAVTDKSVKVLFNSSPIQIRNFEQYVDMYIGSKSETTRIYEQSDPRWEYAVCLTPVDEFTQVSFVNGIYTSKGGKHVEYILNQILRMCVDYIEKRKKVKVKQTTIKEQLMLFVNCIVENPTFDSQTKDFMNTAIPKFGSSCKVSENFIEKIIKLGIMDKALSLNEVKHSKDAKKTDGKKTKMIRGIPKLVDANMAGTSRSGETILILCEGDSAKAGILSGLASEDRDYIGVYPLKGKLMNVRDTSQQKINTNNEIAELKKILGLESGKKYNSIDEVKQSLRYGKIIILTDQDSDGHHIKGLILNLFDTQWRDLIKVDNFIGYMNTPILKARRNNGKDEKVFYNVKQYEMWKKEMTDTGQSLKPWSIKYYKGLGTSTGKEFRQYLKEKRYIYFKYDDEKCSETLDMVFNDNRADDRKKWLSDYNKEATIDDFVEEDKVSYRNFVNKELIHFSKYDCERSIPNIMDGLKTSLRKILYCAFKRNLKSEIKVAQFGGYVSEHSGYHHGEMSLMKAIVGMAQEFVGSNNISLLLPNGQFGTRLAGGKDASSERYIFTQLNAITRKLFPEEDNHVLHYLDDDGMQVEPEFYVPIIPMILVNGSKGIGTGFSTDIMCYNPIDLIDYINWKLNINTGTHPEIRPYYEGFKGDIIKLEDEEGKYLFKGKYEVINREKGIIRITELPVGLWTENYIVYLEKMLDSNKGSGNNLNVDIISGSNDNGNGNSPKSDNASVVSKTKIKQTKKRASAKKQISILKDYNNYSTSNNINIEIILMPGMLDMLEKTQYKPHISMIEKELNLVSSPKSTSNMHMFDVHQKLRKYSTVYEIINEYMGIRLEYYAKRKAYIIKKLEREMMILKNKATFIEKQCNNTIDLRRKKGDEVVKILEEHGFDKIDEEDQTYKYLRSMSIDSFIEENVSKLNKEYKEKTNEYEKYKVQTTQEMWKNELEELKEAYEQYREERNRRMIEDDSKDTETLNDKKKVKIHKTKKIKIVKNKE